MDNIVKINDSKFKSIYFSYNFIYEIKSNEYSKNAVMALILSKSCTKYDTTKKLQERLSELYGASFEVDFQKLGDLFNVEFRLTVPNMNYIPNKEDVFIEALNVLKEIIYNPLIQNGLFNIDVFEREKQYVKNKINTRKDDKLRYGISRCEELLCDEENYGNYIFGDIDQIESVTNEQTVSSYYNMVNNSGNCIMISGNLDGYEDIDEKINQIFNLEKSSKVSIEELRNKINNVKHTDKGEIIERLDTAQSVIGIGLRARDITKDYVYTLNVYNTILGGTPSSKLFQNVREKYSLAYTTRSRYYRFKDAIILYAGIDEVNYNKAKEVMFEQINAIKNGDISDIELSSAKESLISDIKEWNDSKVVLSKQIIINKFENRTDKMEDMIERINKVTKEDIVNISKHLHINLVYLLGGEIDAK